MLEKFSLDAQKLITLAESLAFDLGSISIGKEHLFLAILKNEENILSVSLRKYGIDFKNFLKHINCNSLETNSFFYMEYSESFKKFLEKTVLKSKEYKEERVSVEILSLLLVNESDGMVYEYLKSKKVDKKDIMNNLTKMTKKKSDLDNIIDLHDLSLIKKDPLIGREKELDQLIRALKRRNKPNALLIGSPGIGKTAIVEELALLLSQNKIKGLEGKRIYELDLSSVVGGTKYRGEFEEKLKKIIKKVKEDGNAIIFIDEIHNIIKAGGAEGAIDASNILKPYLSRGEIQLIGATTTDEYHMTIAKDKALSRRFQIINVNQPTVDETRKIMHKLKPIYEKFYNIKIDNNVIDYIVDIADKYLLNRTFPDKAIDILDNSCVIASKCLSIDDVDSTVMTFYNISVSVINKSDSVIKRLTKEIIGQDEVIYKLGHWLRMIEKGVKFKNKPLGVLLFVGPSGVGKSQTAKIIANSFFDNEEAFIRLDMNGYKEQGSLNKLIGSAPGFSGHEEKSKFIKLLTSYPNSVILIDDIDKANLETMEFFSNIFEEGYFYDSKQEKIDCTNAIFIMTSNIGTKENELLSRRIHFENQHANLNIYELLSNKLGSEFINKIDDIFEFKHLSLKAQKELFSQYLEELTSSLDMEIGTINENIDDELVARFGARYIKKRVVNSISEIISENEKNDIKS